MIIAEAIDASHDGGSAKRDRWALFAARGLRGFGDGFAIIILPAYLSAIGYGPIQIGFIATASLLGSAVLTLAIGFLGTRRICASSCCLAGSS